MVLCYRLQCLTNVQLVQIWFGYCRSEFGILYTGRSTAPRVRKYLYGMENQTQQLRFTDGLAKKIFWSRVFIAKDCGSCRPTLLPWILLIMLIGYLI